MNILHVDMDAFYASVEERDNPALKEQPIAVGGSPDGRGVVSTANYIARRFGVHSAMPAITAKRLCPPLVFVRPRMQLYASISSEIREIFHRYTPVVETLSLDEAFLDVDGCERLHGSSVKIGEGIRDAIQDETGLAASVGIASNKFLAKLASDLDKPNGFVQITPARVHEVLDPLPVSRLWGVGKSTRKRLESLGAYSIRDVRMMPESELRQHFGTLGKRLSELASGIDQRRVVPYRDSKSVSHETTFSEDLTDIEAVMGVLLSLTEDVTHRLRQNELQGQTIHVKIRHADFKTVVRSRTLSERTDQTRKIWQAVDELARLYLKGRHVEIRLLGVGVSGLASRAARDKVQTELFSDSRPDPLDSLVDDIEQRFGHGSVRRAKSLSGKPRK